MRTHIRRTAIKLEHIENVDDKGSHHMYKIVALRNAVMLDWEGGILRVGDSIGESTAIDMVRESDFDITVCERQKEEA